MQILWIADAPLSAAEVIARLETKANWNPKTVRTFLSRLVQKQTVRTVKKNLAGYELLHYVPLIDRASAFHKNASLGRTERRIPSGMRFGGGNAFSTKRCIPTECPLTG